ncbi:sensor histidine kinase [Luteimonas sp. 22616]|uniref:sensor histidine kinase n=1 Tax=Luteimonas sp. 22616 TaxID=3453951 RepID=UPI003F8620C1
MLADAGFFKEIVEELDRLEKEAGERLPQALHELRKLNALVKANAEKLGGNDASVQEVRDISGSAELMSNIFDVIEALANIDGLKLLKLDEFIAVYDLAFKAKKIFQSRAKIKPIHIHLSGDDSVGVSGSRKTFPLVLTILLENAIKYGKVDSTIDIRVDQDGPYCVVQVSNRSDFPIDSRTCFDRGVRFVGDTLDGDGLGLFLAREIVRSHNGQISCAKIDDVVTIRVSIPAHAQRKGRR